MMTPAWANEFTQEIQSPALSIYGTSTSTEFYKAVQGGDVANGMLNRFLLLATSKKSAEVEPIADLDDIPAGLKGRLQHAYLAFRDPLLASNPTLPQDNPEESGEIARVVPWGPGAHAIYSSFAKECEDGGDNNPELEPFFARSAEMAGRLATIRAVGCNIDEPVVNAADIAWACDIARWSAERMADDTGDLMSDNAFGAVRAKIVGKMKESKGQPIKDRDLRRASGISGKDFAMQMKDLRELGRVIPCEITNRGQTSKAWRLVANDNVKPVRKR